ncbi:MAG: histidinol-phosphatase HisJ family protein [Planctomycetota bacterium]
MSRESNNPERPETVGSPAGPESTHTADDGASFLFPGVERTADVTSNDPSIPPKPAPGLFDAHTHTPLCKHARGDIEKYATVALRRGLAGLTVTCHNPMPDGFAPEMRMDACQLDEYVMYVERARHVFEGRLDIRLGLEADFFPGTEDYVAEQLARHEFDFVLGSVHPQIPDYKERYFTGDLLAYQQQYFYSLAESAESGLFDSLSHPDMVKHLMPRHWSVSKILGDACRALDRIAATGVAMEFNTSGWRKPMNEASPGPRLLYEMARRRIPITLGSDAHQPQRVGGGFRKALRLLEAAGYRHVTVFKQRRPVAVPIAAAYTALTKDGQPEPAA